MNSEELLLVDQVADAGSLSAAALRLGCDVSTLSRRIAQLEQRLGCRLFHRSGRGVGLTVHGHSLQRYAQQVRELMEQAQGALAALQDTGPASLHLAAQPTIAKLLFGGLFHALRQEFPGTRIKFTEGLASGILAQLQQGEVDAAILYKPASPSALHYQALAAERICLVTPPGFRSERAQWYFENLEDIPLILPSTRHGLRVLAETLAARHGFAPRIVLESDSSIDITLELVRQGCGCTLLPRAAVLQDLERGVLQAFELRDAETVREIAWVPGKTLLGAHDAWRLRRVVASQVQARLAGGHWPGATAV